MTSEAVCGSGLLNGYQEEAKAFAAKACNVDQKKQKGEPERKEEEILIEDYSALCLQLYTAVISECIINEITLNVKSLQAAFAPFYFQVGGSHHNKH